MYPKDLIAKLEKLPQDKSILCQVVPSEGHGAWNMHFEFFDVPDSWMIQLRISHPELKKLPDVSADSPKF